MEKEEFVEARTRLDKTRKEMSQLLGVSVKAMYSYEQGWRSIPAHVERQVFFLLSQKKGRQEEYLPFHMCWYGTPTLFITVHVERQVFFLLSQKKREAGATQTLLGGKKMPPQTTQRMSGL